MYTRVVVRRPKRLNYKIPEHPLYKQMQIARFYKDKMVTKLTQICNNNLRDGDIAKINMQ